MLASTRSDADAVRDWFKLYDEYGQLEPDTTIVEDPRTGQTLSILSLVAVLPEPALWPTMRSEAYRRAESADVIGDERVSELGVALLFDALLNDTSAQTKTLDQLQVAVSKASPTRREQAQPLIAEWRKHLDIEYGRFDPTAELLKKIDSYDSTQGCCFFLPMLIKLSGANRARQLLERLLFEKRIEFWFPDGDGTLALAQQIAAQNPERLAIAQWNLARGERALEMLHAMGKLDCKRHPCTSSPDNWDTLLARAPRRIRGFLIRPLIQSGDDEHATQILLDAEDTEIAAYTLSEALQEMIESGDGAQALAFMRGFLLSESADNYWGTLSAFALATDERYANDAYALLASAPSNTPDLEETRTLLSRATNSTHADIDSAAAIAEDLRQRLQLPVAESTTNSYADDPRLGKTEAALRLAEIGLLEGRDDWIAQGLETTRQILDETRTAAYAAEEFHGMYARNDALQGFVRISVKASRARQAEDALIEELAASGKRCRETDRTGCIDQFASSYAGRHYDTAAKLLMDLYARVGKGSDVGLLLDRYPFWQSRDLAGINFLGGCHCDGSSIAAVARSLLAANERDAAFGLLEAKISNEYTATGEIAELYGSLVSSEKIDRLADDHRLPRGTRLAAAALAAHGANQPARAAALATQARRESLYDFWRLELARMSAEISQSADEHDRWQDSVRAMETADQAGRYQRLGLTTKAQQLLEQALDSAQPGDCIEGNMLGLAHSRGDRNWATSLLKKMVVNARNDTSGAALGCLRGYLEVNQRERSILRSEMLAEATSASSHYSESFAELLLALDGDCDAEDVSANPNCFEARHADAQAAYMGLKRRVQREPNDTDALADLAGFVQRSDFPSLYAGHMDGPPKAPIIDVAAKERDGWTLRQIALDPWALPKGIARAGRSFHSAWSPVIHLAGLWRAARAGESSSEKESAPPPYPLMAANHFQQKVPSSEPSEREPTAEDRAGNAVGSTEIVIMAARFIEPGRHDPCTMCI